MLGSSIGRMCFRQWEEAGGAELGVRCCAEFVFSI